MKKSRKPLVDFRAIRGRLTMEQLLGHYGVLDKFKRTGTRLTGPCPIHNGTNPTQFRVDTERNIFNCFSECKHGGNVLDFIAKKEDISIHDAALKACEWFGIPVDEVRVDGASHDESDDSAELPPKPQEKPKSNSPPEKSSREPLAKPEEIGSNKPLAFTLKNLDANHAYLAERGLDSQTIAEFGLGYCAKGSMSGRIVIPIHNVNGELVAYAGRWPGEPLADSPKYRLPAGFKKSAELFNLHRALKRPVEEPLILVEGFFDAIKLWQNGARKVVAIMGSIVSPAQEELITRYFPAGSDVLLMFDEDNAGRFCREQAMLKFCERYYVRTFKFAEEGRQPEHLSADELNQILGGSP